MTTAPASTTALRLGAVSAALVLAGCQTLQTVSDALHQTLQTITSSTTSSAPANVAPCHNAPTPTHAPSVLLGQVAHDQTAAALGTMSAAQFAQRHCELTAALAPTSTQPPFELATLDVVTPAGQRHTLGTQLRVGDALSNAPANATPAQPHVAQPVWGSIAAQLRRPFAGESPEQTTARLQAMQLLVVVHTSDEGASTPATLAAGQQRARAVAEVLAAQGFERSQLYFQNAAEHFPIASNHTAAGRALNQRIEIIDVASPAALNAYFNARTTDLSHLRARAENQLNTPEKIPAKSPTQTTAKSVAKSPQNPSKTTSQTTITRAPIIQSGKKAAIFVENNDDYLEEEIIADSNQPKIDGQIKETIIEKSPRHLDFNGRPWQRPNIAEAATPALNCALDAPRPIPAPQSLQTLAPRPQAASAPPSWTAQAGPHWLVVQPIAASTAPRPTSGANAAAPSQATSHTATSHSAASHPVPPTFELLLYANHRPTAPSAKIPTPDPLWRGAVHLNTYRTASDTLHRFFIPASAGASLRCLDVRLPHATPTQAAPSTLLYERNGQLLQAPLTAQIRP